MSTTPSKTPSPLKRAINRLAPHEGWVEPQLKKKRRQTNPEKFDPSPVKLRGPNRQQQKLQRQQLHHLVKSPSIGGKRSRRPKSLPSEFVRGDASSTTPPMKRPVGRPPLNAGAPQPVVKVASVPKGAPLCRLLATDVSLKKSVDLSVVESAPQSAPESTTAEAPAAPLPSRKARCCRFCGQLYSRSDNLKRHIEVMHRRKTGRIRCKLCGATFSSVYILANHVRYQHKRPVGGTAAAATQSSDVASASTVSSAAAAAAPTPKRKRRTAKQIKADIARKGRTKSVKHQSNPKDLDGLINGFNIENAAFAEKVRSKWFESPSTPSSSTPARTSISPSTGQTPVEGRESLPSAPSASPSPSKLSHRALIQKILLSKQRNGVKGQASSTSTQPPSSVLRNHSPDPNVQLS